MTKRSVDAVLIAGPTASGKSALAVALAAACGGAVVNADSMQVYRELRVLTARPSAADEARAPHRLYGHVGVHRPFSVGRYAGDAQETLAQLQAERRLPIFTGGTGLYFGALTEGLAEIPFVPPATREAVRHRRGEMGAEAFHAELVRRDPASAALKPGDTQRTLRAMEVLEATGSPLGYWHACKGRPVLAGLRLARFVVAPQRAELYARIDARFAHMLAGGALAEAGALMGLDPALPAAKALGLRPLQDHLAGRLTLEEAAAEACQSSRNYAKRQLTWFRHRMADWTWLEPCGNILPELIAAVS